MAHLQQTVIVPAHHPQSCTSCLYCCQMVLQISVLLHRASKRPLASPEPAPFSNKRVLPIRQAQSGYPPTRPWDTAPNRAACRGQAFEDPHPHSLCHPSPLPTLTSSETLEPGTFPNVPTPLPWREGLVDMEQGAGIWPDQPQLHRNEGPCYQKPGPWGPGPISQMRKLRLTENSTDWGSGSLGGEYQRGQPLSPNQRGPNR